jgi:hypothetical protein
MRHNIPTSWSYRPLLVLAASLMMLCVFTSLSMPTTARAVAEKPFGIRSFAIQTIERTEELAVERPEGIFKSPGFEFINKPYKFTQAGGHPWALSTSGEFTSEQAGEYGFLEKIFLPGAFPVSPTQDPRDVIATLPPGLIGDPQAVSRCSLSVVTAGGGLCPTDTIVGWYMLSYGGESPEYVGPIVNVTPSVGESAEFVLENETPLDQGILTAHLVRVENPVTKQHEYELTVGSKEIPLLGVFKFELTFWGVPADPSHNAMRGRFCKRGNVIHALACTGGETSAGIAPVPFLSLGTDCSAGPETATLRADSWQEPGSIVEGHYMGYAEATTAMPPLTGCNLLPFAAEVETQPDTRGADEPVGLGVNVRVPQNEKQGANATPQLRDAVVTLPEGMSVNPGVVDGIQACDEGGPEGINFEGSESEEVGPSGELQLAPGHCPNASTVGTAEAITPLLAEPVKGHVYLARPKCGGAGQAPCTDQDALDGNLYQLYLELGGTGELANAGINIKAHGYVEANPATGQLTTKFLQNPQLPFSELKVHLNGGPRASLASPAVCGPATTTADFTPWSAPGTTPEGLLVAGTADATPSSFFEVAGCASPPGLAPGFVAGTVTPQAGQFTQFTLNLSRQDREQYIKGIQVHTPPGLLGMLSSVPLCPETQADNPSLYGTCEASKIGTTRVASGAGSHPFEIEGSVYLTGPYQGAPFGLSIVTHAVAGPFNLGLVVVRARIEVDPVNSTLTITTDETGPYAVPQIIFGVPLRLQRITVDINRPDFIFNPTNCQEQQITATISGSQDAVATVASPFSVGGCKSLAFKPKFTASTSAHTSRKDGASLDVKLSYPAGSVGSEANIARAKVSLPKILPSRLSTLQKACPAATFEVNPAGCQAASIVGVVRATTPLLPVGLSGPVYFVSHGGEEFPSLIVVLQGDNVRVDLTGTTFINKAGITSSTFKTVPDVPVSTFELYLPEGKYSALAGNGNLCDEQGKLLMPTEFVAQNGAVMKQSTKISVTGCAKGTAKAKERKVKSARVRRAGVGGKAGSGR